MSDFADRSSPKNPAKSFGERVRQFMEENLEDTPTGSNMGAIEALECITEWLRSQKPDDSQILSVAYEIMQESSTRDHPPTIQQTMFLKKFHTILERERKHLHDTLVIIRDIASLLEEYNNPSDYSKDQAVDKAKLRKAIHDSHDPFNPHFSLRSEDLDYYSMTKSLVKEAEENIGRILPALDRVVERYQKIVLPHFERGQGPRR